MRRLYVFLVTAPLLIPEAASAVRTELGSTTILRMEQRAVTGQPKQDLLPATQFLSIDSSGLADGNLSLHLAGWGRFDLADKSYSDGTIDGSFTYGYIRYRFAQANADVRAGRFFLREGIINEQVDGASARTDLPFGFYLSAFGGIPVKVKSLADEDNDGKGNGIAGGRLAYRYRGLLELGMAGIYEGTAPILTSHNNYSHRLVGGDIWFSPIGFLELLGHTSYNMETEEVAEHSYLLQLKPVKQLVLTGEFNDHRELSFLGATWARFPGSPIAPGDKSRSIGASAAYAITPAIEVVADYKHYKRDFGTADRIGGDLKLSLQGHALSGGLGYHHLRAGEGFAIGTNSSGSYNELRAYILHDAKDHFVALDAIGYFLKEAVDDEKNAWEAKLSAGYYLTPNLIISGDGSYGRNPEHKDETKGLLRLTYNTTFGAQGGKK